MSKRLLRFLLLSNTLVLGVFAWTFYSKYVRRYGFTFEGDFVSMDILIGATPFVVSFFYLVYANIRAEREEGAFGRVLDDPSFTTDDPRQRTDDGG